MSTILFLGIFIILGSAVLGQERQSFHRNEDSDGQKSQANPFNTFQHSNTDMTVRNSIQELTFDLAYEKSLRSRENQLFSPFSIGALLSLLMLGTDGQTSRELSTALYYTGKREETIHNSYKSLIENLDPGIPGVEIKMTNQLFLKRGLPIKKDFIDKAKFHYNAGVQMADFESNPSGVVRKVNDYVSRETNGKINDLIKNPFSPRSVFVAVNTLFFNGLWEEPFSTLYTYNGTFFTGNSQIYIPMMVNEGQTARFLSGENFGFSMIALPYKGGRFSMYIITPEDNNNINDLEASLDSIIINSLIKRMTPQKLTYTIPRMQLKKSVNLKADLKRLGIKSLFNPSANFQKMTISRNIFVEDVVHEALLEITETGTVAAAASAGTSDRILAKTFIFNKPSLLFIRDDITGVILFWAKVMQPVPLLT